MRLFLSKLFVFTTTALLAVSCSTSRCTHSGHKDISPYDYGLATAKTGVERYEVLLKTHRAAVAAGVNVDYSGIDSLDIEIPQSFKRIPLTPYNDFKGCVLNIRNTSKRVLLFSLVKEGISVRVDKKLIDKGDFRSISELSKGKCLLLIEDEKPWVLNRKGHDYGHQRKDILLVENGRAKNKTTMPYNNEYSSPKCTYIPLYKDESFVVKNLTVRRDPSCQFVTFVFSVSGFDNVQFSNVSIYTPENDLTGDRAISVINSTNVTFTDVHIEGTYSQKNYFGYGISLNNVWNFKANRLYGNGNWGIFGTNNVNTAYIENSQINRFDIHCYGRDLSYKNVELFDRYNSHASVFGTIKYDHCVFTNFVPSQYGGSYNAFVEHEIVLNDCVFNIDPKRNYFCRPMTVTSEVNARPELSKKCLPNIKIKNLTVNMAKGAKDFYLIFIREKDEVVETFGGISWITINGLTINAAPSTPVQSVQLCNRQILTDNEVSCTMSHVVVNQPKTGAITKSASADGAVLKMNLPIKGGAVRLSNIKNIRLEVE